MKTIAGYNILEVINNGTKSMTYRGQRPDQSQTVILKVLKAEYPSLKDVARLKHEYEITKDLDIDGIIKSYGLEKHGHGLVLLLEDPGGVSLTGQIANHPLEPNIFLTIAIQLAETLGLLHQHNIIHKDIKPDNIIVNIKTGRVKITDFGISSRLTRESQQINHPNLLEGSLAYMSPEQTGRMNRAIDYRTDFYSLGVTFYELLTGKLPFQAYDPLELVHAHIAKQPVPPYSLKHNISKTISDIVLRLMAKTAEERYQNAYGLRADLQACLSDLQTTGKIHDFKVGQHDISDKFQIPQKLYGREKEISDLMAAFERVSQGTTELTLVSGYAGIGKSTLVHEIHKPIVRQRGYFIAGKFDQLQRNIPYSALIHAFQDLIRQILTESVEHITAWKEKLLAALSPNGQVIIEVIPEVELIIGPQPPVPALGPAEMQNRFNLVWQKFIRVFTAQDHPLALFLDDLQWADVASLQLIQRLVTNQDSQYLLMVVAYRDNEIGAAHPWRLTLEQIKEEGAHITHIGLSALDVVNVNRLVADTLQCRASLSEPLAGLIFQKTNGNPFFVLQFFKILYQENLLMFVPLSTSEQQGQSPWHWNVAKIQELDLTDNVIDLMAGKIKKLALPTQAVLKLAACIGNTFDLKTLSTVYEKSSPETAAELWEAIQEGLLVGVTDFGLTIYDLEEMEAHAAPSESPPQAQTTPPVYKFLHDRVQQAVYSLIESEDRKAVHFKIGRLWLQQIGENKTVLQEKIFDLVNHLNLGTDLLASETDQLELAHLNLLAGQKAKAATAYEAALTYTKAGIHLLSQASWQHQYDLAFALHLEYAECEFLVGNFETAEVLCNLIFENAKTDLDKYEVYNLKVILYTSLNRYREVLEIGREAARLLGLNLPAAPRQVDIIREFLKAKWHLLGKQPEALLALPLLQDVRQSTLIDLLLNLASAAFLSNQDFAILIALKMFNITLKYGISKASPFSYMIYGAVNVGLGNFNLAYQFGQLALELNQRVNNADLEPVHCFIFGDVINHWSKHVQTSADYLMRGYEAALERGDLNFADFNLLAVMYQSFFKGDTLDQALARCEQYLDFYTQAKGAEFTNTLQGQTGLVQRQLILCLKGLTQARGSLSDDHFDERQLITGLTENLERFFYYTFKLPALYIFEDYSEALKIALAEEEVIAAAMLIGQVRVPEHYFYYSLTLSALFPTASPQEKKQYLKTLRKNRKKLKKYADHCPENSLHKYLLVAAEMARIAKQEKQAMDLYDQAIKSASDNEFIQNAALANELAAKFYLANDKEKIAKIYLLEARYGYVKWDATEKVKALDEKHPELMTALMTGREPSNALMTTTTDHGTTDQLDLSTVIKASQAISGEIELDKLLAKLMRIVIENAGAQKGLLLLEKKGHWVIETEGMLEKSENGDDPEITALQPTRAENSQNLSMAIVNYVARTKETVVLNNATQEGLFTQDAYIIQNQPKSILCLPLVNQGKLTGILYLENNLTTGAFTTDRLEVLKLLSAQAAISIENASLYSHQVALTTGYSRFVPPEFLRFLSKESIVEVKLGDHVQQEMAVLFSDIRSFTTLSETMTPQENFDFVNAYFAHVSPIIRQHNGVIVKYLGDGMMAVFPEQIEDALNASIAKIQQVSLFNTERQQRGEVPIRIGVGIHTGKMMLGTVGESERMQSDFLSDAVNLTARLEGLTKLYGASIVISQEALNRIKDPTQYQLRFLDRVQVKGRLEAVAVFEIFGGEPEETIELKLQTKTKFEEGLTLYYGQQFAAAGKLFNEVLKHNPDDQAAKLYLERSEHYRVHGAPADWAGLRVLNEK